METKFRVFSKVTHNGSHVKCDACSRCISENTWYLVVLYRDTTHAVHDNDVCLETLKSHLGLAYDHFLVTIAS